LSNTKKYLKVGPTQFVLLASVLIAIIGCFEIISDMYENSEELNISNIEILLQQDI
jgi:hypothetical protein